LKLEFTCTIGEKIFRIDDVSDEAPMAQIEFFNEFAELPYEVRRNAAKLALECALTELARGASSNVDRVGTGEG
jgi:hypothetical protein